MLLCDNCQFNIRDFDDAMLNDAGFWRHRKCPKRLPRPRRPNLNIRCLCTSCGWSFTVHTDKHTLQSDAYGPMAEWFCPHCGQPVQGGKG